LFFGHSKTSDNYFLGAIDGLIVLKLIFVIFAELF